MTRVQVAILAALVLVASVTICASLATAPLSQGRPAKYITTTPQRYTWTCAFDLAGKQEGDVVRGRDCRRVEVPQ